MFGGWIASELEMSSKTANRFMSVARLWGSKMLSLSNSALRRSNTARLGDVVQKELLKPKFATTTCWPADERSAKVAEAAVTFLKVLRCPPK